MKVAVVGSRGLTLTDLQKYLPTATTELISGGAKGVDACVKNYANEWGIPLTEFLPDYRHYGKGAPLKRNRTIVETADAVVAFWDGLSKGTAYVIDLCAKMRKPITVYMVAQQGVFIERTEVSDVLTTGGKKCMMNKIVKPKEES